jgi:hypothetical protein
MGKSLVPTNQNALAIAELYARVRPLVGDALATRRVAVAGEAMAGALVEYLVACGVRRWVALPGAEWMVSLIDHLRCRYGALDITLEMTACLSEREEVDVALFVDDGSAFFATESVTRLAIFTPKSGLPCHALLALPGERLNGEHPTSLGGQSVPDWPHRWDWLTAAPLMVLWVRALLLQGTCFAMTKWEEAWQRGVRAYTVGETLDPTQAGWQLPPQAVGNSRAYRTPYRRQGTLLVVGLGSLGSVAAHQLAPWVERMVLVDPDCVEVANLVRQHYSSADVGQPKAVALAHLLRAADSELACEWVVDSLSDEEEVSALVRRFGVTGALVTTGSNADFAVARGLRAQGVPHVVGRCYARARYWEGIVVDAPDQVGPSYEEMRRGVAAGPTPAPTPEERAAYGVSGTLAGEPATAMECGWAAMWLARLTSQMIMPAPLREGWLWARLAVGANCFIGGVVAEPGSEGLGAAYGVAVPGQVHAWSVGEIH